MSMYCAAPLTNIRKFIVNLPGIMALAAGIAVVGDAAWQAARAQEITNINARVIAVGIRGASAISQVGMFLNNPVPPACAHPIPTLFLSYTQAGAVLDPNRILVGSRSNFHAPLADGVGSEGSFLSIDPSGPAIMFIPPNFARSGDQASTLDGAVQMFSANSPHWRNDVNNAGANTASYTGVSNPLGLSNNNAFGRLWPANAPFGDTGVGSSSILDPTGLPLAGAPNPKIGGVYVGSLTNRNLVTAQSQVIKGSLSTGAVGTACRSWDPPGQNVEPRLGALMNPYTGAAPQLFVSEPFNNTIAVINLVVGGTQPNQVFDRGSVSHISSPSLNFPVDLAPVQRDRDNPNWASNTTLDEGSDFYVANRGNNTIVRMHQNGTVVTVRGVTVDLMPNPLHNGSLNGIATSTDGTTIYVTFTGPGESPGGLLALPAF
jgi:hypothetical protein